ncbi:unnamed protein product, partial [Ilex paraguariensis]
ILGKLDMSERLLKWAIELGEFDIQYQARVAIKAQTVTDFVTELTALEEEVAPSPTLGHVPVLPNVGRPTLDSRMPNASLRHPTPPSTPPGHLDHASTSPGHLSLQCLCQHQGLCPPCPMQGAQPLPYACPAPPFASPRRLTPHSTSLGQQSLQHLHFTRAPSSFFHLNRVPKPPTPSLVPGPVFASPNTRSPALA